MEMKLGTVIEILKQELDSERPPAVGVERVSTDTGKGIKLGIERCVDLLTKISEVGETRTYFEFGEGDDNLVLLIPYDRQEDFLSYLEVALNREASPGNTGDYLSIQGILSNEYPRERDEEISINGKS